MNATEEANVMKSMKEIGVKVDGLVEVFNERNVMVLNKTFLFGRHLIHEKLQDVFVKMLKIEKDNDLTGIIISETGPKGKYAEYLPELKMMVISLPKLLSGAIETVDSRESNLSVTAGIWTNMIYAFVHELYHNMSLSNIQDLDNVDEEKEESCAHKYGLDMVEEVQRTMDAEPPILVELPWFGNKIMKHMIEKIQAGDKNWVKQKEMADAGIIYKSGSNEWASLREYYKDTSKDPVWENEGIELELRTELTMKDKEFVTIEEEPSSMEPHTKSKIVDQLLSKNTGEEMTDLDMQETLGSELTEQYMNKSDALADQMMSGQETPLTAPAEETIQEEVSMPPDKPKPEPTPPVPMNITNACRTLWMKLYNHMFSYCSWKHGVFCDPKAVTNHPIIIKDNLTAAAMMGSDTVTGLTFVNDTIPGYDIILNIKGVKRSFRLIAQNPTKASSYAQKARQGDKIAWLIETTNGGDYKALIQNGVYCTQNSGQWTPVS